MGLDDVAVCKFYCSGANCQATVEHYFNRNRNSMPLDSANRQIGFSNVRVLRANGKLLCSFTRMNSMPSLPDYYDSAAKPYFILNADGVTDNNGILKRISKMFTYFQWAIWCD